MPPFLSARMVSSASRSLSSTSRISTCSNCSICALLRQGEPESGAGAGAALCPYAAAMAGHDALHQRQADAGSRKLSLVVQALEHAEQLVLVAGVEAGAVVAHRIDMLEIVAGRADFDARPRLAGAEL